MILTLIGQRTQRNIQLEQIVLVQPTRPHAPEDVLGELLRILRADKLVIVRRANVDERLDGLNAVGWVKGRVVDGVAVDLADVEILFHFGDLFRDDAVGDAPDTLRGRAVVVGEGGPVGALDEGDDAAGGLGGAAVVLAK